MAKKTYYDKLMSMTKDVIYAQATNLGAFLSKNRKKAEMARQLSDYVMENAHVWLRSFTKMELDIVKEIADPGSGGRSYPLYQTDEQLCLEVFRILDYELDIDDEFYFTMPEELIFAVRKGLPGAMAFREENSYLDFERVALGILNMYGVIDPDEFVRIFYDAFDLEHDHALFERALLFIIETKVLAGYVCIIEGEQYYCAPGVDDSLAETILEERKRRPEIREKKEFTKEEYMNAGMDQLCPVVGDDSPSGRRLREYLKAKGVDNLDVPGYFTDLWFASQLPGTASVKEAMDIMSDLGFTSLEDINDGMGCVMEYFNNVPRWILSGYSSAEIYGKFEKPVLQQLPDLNPVSPAEGSYNALTMLGDVMSGRIPKVGRNDPCPCGSGKKYKNCHGKES